MHNRIITAILGAATLAACSLEDIKEGEFCPPNDNSESKVFLFDNTVNVELNDVRCPEKSPKCIAFTSNDQLFGHYFCASPCQGRQILCDGKCTDLDTASDECKAVNHIVENGAEGEKCTTNSCAGDYVLLCHNGTYKKHETACPYGCANGECKSENDTGQPTPSDSTTCKTDTYRCENGNVQYCKDKKWVEYKTCEWGCNDATKDCKKNEDVKPIPKDNDTYCEGQVLHYKGSDGKEYTDDCAAYASLLGVECQTLMDGTSACVYTPTSYTASGCRLDKEFLDARCFEFAGTLFLEFMMCTNNSKNEMVAVRYQAVSACIENDGLKGVICTEDSVKGYNILQFFPCEHCTNVKQLSVTCQ